MLSLILLSCMAMQMASSLKIYIYEMPEEFHDRKRFGDQINSPGCFYTIDAVFPSLLRESPVFTKNPEEANYFHIDAWMYWEWLDIDKVVKEVRRQGPWYDRHGGKDHILIVSADPGRCQYPQRAGENMTYLTHMGKVQYLEDTPCNLFKKWGGECDYHLMAAKAATIGPIQRPPCHIPGQDIVVPPTPFEDFKNSHPSPYIGDTLKGLNRSAIFYYSGKIDIHSEENDSKSRPWSDAHYSFGVRQTLHHMFNDLPGYQLKTNHAHGAYWTDLSSSIFCVAAAGWGWGGRMKAAVTRGCIPVIVQDGIRVEWEEQLPLKDYAIRLPLWLVHKLPDILDYFIKSGKVEKMQKALQCAWRLHWWRMPHGRAFQVVMCELKKRTLKAQKINVDWEACTLECGDGKKVSMTSESDFHVF